MSYINSFCSGKPFSEHFDIMSPPAENDHLSWKLHVIKTPWNPPKNFAWPHSNHNKKKKVETR